VDRIVDGGAAAAVGPVLGHGLDVARARLDQHLGLGVVGRVVHVAAVGQDVVDRVGGGVLVLFVQRGVDLQAAGGQQAGPGLGRLGHRGVVDEDVLDVVAEER